MSAPATITVLEGLDGAGKTYAANLREDKEFRATSRLPFMIHNGPPDPRLNSYLLYRHYLTQLRTAVIARKRGVSTIIDRSWPSEAVYGPVYRGRSLLSDRQIHRLERFAAENNIITIAISAPREDRLNRLLDRGEHWDPYLQTQLENGYRNYFQSHKGWITASSSLAKH